MLKESEAINRFDEDGQTTLHIAVTRGLIDVAKLLIEYHYTIDILIE